jgi:eukaryotic-like serine/threonine-protein kinase
MLTAGKKIGPYEITAAIGAGGMGEVYRARDSRLGRDVAIKVLPENLAADEDRLKRFEKEARAASALNHPNVVTVYDIGFQDSIPYLAMEFVNGSTLRRLMNSEPMSIRKILEIAIQVAEGLAKAHSEGIVHRDLKPENVILSNDGYAKILDFGLAKLIEQPKNDTGSNLPTAATIAGTVLGTAAYMSPEQASGHPTDFRTDQFSFGTLLYEMVTGKNAFSRNSAPETMAAIIREDPEPITQLTVRVPVPLRWIIERCLSKDPEDRYASTRDLARDLAIVLDHLSEINVAIDAVDAAPAKSIPSFQRLTFRRGHILSARFAPDGQTMIYGAWWEGNACKLFSTRPESPESTPLQLPDAEILSISRSGMMAISLERVYAGRFIWSGILAQVPVGGGAPREILEDVEWADWGPDGENLAVIRRSAGKHVLEYPIDNVLYETAGWISHVRVSPKGNLVAFLDHPLQGDDSGSVVVVDHNRKTTILSANWITAYGLTWSSENEIWFTATRVGVARSIWAVTLNGKERLLARTPGELTIHDVSRDGRVLITSDSGKVGTIALTHAQEKDFSQLDWSRVLDISPDGKMLLFDETGEGGGSDGAVYVRKLDGSPAVRLGEGRAFGFSPDGRWVTSQKVIDSKGIMILPVKTGARRTIPTYNLSIHYVRWYPDGQQFLLAASEESQNIRLYVQNIDGSQPRLICEEAMIVGTFPISPDGKFVVAQNSDGHSFLFPLQEGKTESIPSLDINDRAVRWTPVGNSIYGFTRGELPMQVFLLDLATGRKEPVRELMPPDPAGIVEINAVQISSDGASCAYSFHRILSDLLLVDGL